MIRIPRDWIDQEVTVLYSNGKELVGELRSFSPLLVEVRTWNKIHRLNGDHIVEVSINRELVSDTSPQKEVT